MTDDQINDESRMYAEKLAEDFQKLPHVETRDQIVGAAKFHFKPLVAEIDALKKERSQLQAELGERKALMRIAVLTLTGLADE